MSLTGNTSPSRERSLWSRLQEFDPSLRWKWWEGLIARGFQASSGVCTPSILHRFFFFPFRPCSVWKGLKRFERDWRGLNPLQVKILLKPPQSPSIPVARGLTEHGLSEHLSIKGSYRKTMRHLLPAVGGSMLFEQ